MAFDYERGRWSLLATMERIDAMIDSKIDLLEAREKRRSLVIQAVEDLLDDDEQVDDMDAWLAMAGILAPKGTKISAQLYEVHQPELRNNSLLSFCHRCPSSSRMRPAITHSRIDRTYLDLDITARERDVLTNVQFSW